MLPALKITAEWSDPGEFYTVHGGDGDDTITGDEWPNKLVGGRGADTIYAGGGDDIVWSTHDDFIVDLVSDTIDCGDGVDTVMFDSARDTVTNCENLYPSSG